ncbi:hypothetical protein AWZ03_015127, partial [Drosophila navojoa]
TELPDQSPLRNSHIWAHCVLAKMSLNWLAVDIYVRRLLFEIVCLSQLPNVWKEKIQRTCWE